MLGKENLPFLSPTGTKSTDFRHFSQLARPLQCCRQHRIVGASEHQGVKTMQSVSNGLARTVVAVAGTLLCGSALMVAALGPGVAQAHAAPVAAHQTVVR
jgi:hypothetical protein